MKILILPENSVDKTQMDLFGEAKDLWLEATLEVAQTMPSPFWFGDLRAKCMIAPANSNWWGALTKKMLAHGFYLTRNWRRSRTESRKGGIEMEWAK